mmetsp:Transcript_23246/g.57510  ORF Transcript_23246/g.57510 Transcript_23246/m.57510 type:complete len:270 (-) Transcript_23246:1066-1875(-)
MGQLLRKLRECFLVGRAYTTNKKVSVECLPLQVLFLVSCAVILLYVATSMLLFHSYARFEAPTGTFNVWGDLNARTPSTLEPYCDGSAEGREFAPLKGGSTGGLLFANISCPSLNAADIYRISGNEALVFTSRITAQETDGCASIDAMDLNEPISSFYGRTYQYTSPLTNETQTKPCVETTFVNGVEQFQLSLIHTISTSFLGGGEETFNIPCVLEGTNRRFEKGEIVRFTVGDLLKAAHKTLDGDPQRSIGHGFGISFRMCISINAYL